MNVRPKPPFLPMEAVLVDEPPVGDNWLYEPKWDGFRCLAFRGDDEIYLQSKSGQPLTRYFPDLVRSLHSLSAKQFVLDGEIVIPVAGRTSFDDLLMRIHPAASRVQKLAAEHPALLVVFDLLVDAHGRCWTDEPFDKRRAELESFAEKQFGGESMLRLSPATKRLATARRWFNAGGEQLDGIMAKRLDLPYASGAREMQKIKHQRTADCVVGGFRYGKDGKVVGSLLLGLYDEAGLLNHVGFTSSFKTAERKPITKVVEPLKGEPGFTGRTPGGPSRWNNGQSSAWESLRTKLVVEVQYDHFTNGRFRHGTHFLRWRPDKSPEQCTQDQVAQAAGTALKLLNGSRK